MSFFNYDSMFLRAVSKLMDMIFLSILWVVASLPLVTIGASTTALYYTVNKVICHDRSYVWQSFRKSFKENFKQATIVWLINLGIYIVLGMDIYIMYAFYKAGEILEAYYLLLFILTAFVTIWGSYVYPYIARFIDNTKQVMGNALKLAVGNIFWSILIFICFVLTVLVIYIVPIAIIIMPAVYMLAVNKIVERIFRKIMPKEELEAELERNRKII
ncbi:MAG: YesL family protein [Ruminococcus sp.]|nr:YesL family protein [Ruminococcus sp.]